MFWPSLAQKPRLWLGPRQLWLSRNLGQAKTPTDSLALAQLGPSPGFGFLKTWARPKPPLMAWPWPGLAQALAFGRENAYFGMTRLV